MLFDCILWGASCGIIGAVYREILAYETGFTLWWKFGSRFENKWFFRPVWGCAHCFAGQLAAWTFFLLRILPAAIALAGQISRNAVKPWFCIVQAATGLFCLILTISAAILTAKVLSWYFQNKIK